MIVDDPDNSQWNDRRRSEPGLRFIRSEGTASPDPTRREPVNHTAREDPRTFAPSPAIAKRFQLVRFLIVTRRN